MEIQKEKVMKYDFAAIEKLWQEMWEVGKPSAAARMLATPRRTPPSTSSALNSAWRPTTP